MPLGPSNVFTMAEDSPVHKRCDVKSEHHNAVLAGLAIASPFSDGSSTLLAAHTKSVCHFHGFLFIDLTVQADL